MPLRTVLIFLASLFLSVSASAAEPPARKTTVDIQPGSDAFLINNLPTLKSQSYDGHSLEGLLPNSRMVQAIFDDANPQTRKMWSYPDGKPFDADRNTDEFIAALPTYRDHGLLAVTLNLQGGSPQGYSKDQPWINSAFEPDGTLKPAYLARLEKILDKTDELGMVVILGYFYFGQEPRLKSETAVIAATKNATEWLIAKRYTNVLIEIANECDSKYAHDILKPKRTPELSALIKELSQGKVKNAAQRLLVSTSLTGGKLPSADLLAACDFVLLHGNSVGDPKRIGAMVDAVRKLPTYKSHPIVFNEDDHFDFDQPQNNFLAATAAHASWGYFDFRMKNEKFEDGFQSVPTDWSINSPRKKAFFSLLQKMTAPAK